MESTNQGFPLRGSPSPFSSWGDVGAPHMATLSLPGLKIGLLVWLFSTFVIQSTVIPKQSNQQLDDTRVSPQRSTSFVSPSPSSSFLGKDSKTKNQVKIHTLHHPILNLHVSSAKGTAITEIVLASHGS